jgi:murein DD-endopeptidase MepM/ murein hydrolase activator NlpD
MYWKPKLNSPNIWTWPLAAWSFVNIPGCENSYHRGAFGAIRTYDIHTGVDLYCEHDTDVFAVEDGVVVNIETFTGPNAESPWWLPTQSMLVEGNSGVVLYGEIKVKPGRCMRQYFKQIGDKIYAGETIGNTRTIIRHDKGRPMCMLHFELYKPGTIDSEWWVLNTPQPENLLDPTPKLLESFNNLKL